jgi:hypothetical protein
MKNDLWDDWEDFIKQGSVGTLEPGEMTSSMMARKTGKLESTCARLLKKLVDDGKATRRWVMDNGAKIYAYRMVKSSHDERRKKKTA